MIGMPWSSKQSIKVVSGRQTDEVADDVFAAEIARYSRIIVDLGTGDGRYALRAARAHPDTLVVGIDPVAAAMSDSASRAKRKPARGGVANARFVVASLEQLPAVLEGVAAEVSVNFPWGSLLLAVGWPHMDGLHRLVELVKPGGRVLTLLNASAAEKLEHAARLELPPLEDPDHVTRSLVPGWQQAGLTDVSWNYLAPDEEPATRTTWGRRLVRGSGRTTLYVEGRRPPS